MSMVNTIIISPQSSTSGNSGIPSFRNLVTFIIFSQILAMYKTVTMYDRFHATVLVPQAWLAL